MSSCPLLLNHIITISDTKPQGVWEFLLIYPRCFSGKKALECLGLQIGEERFFCLVRSYCIGYPGVTHIALSLNAGRKHLQVGEDVVHYKQHGGVLQFVGWVYRFLSLH